MSKIVATDMEASAIRKSLPSLGEVMTEIGWDRSFADLTEKEALAIIEACVAGFSDAMRDAEIEY